MAAITSLLISRHDYRTKRKANVHFIARELAALGRSRFFSFSFSQISRRTQDQRLSLWDRANRVETMDGVDCYLWRTLLHPSKAPRSLQGLMALYYRAYVATVPATLRRWIAESDHVILEAGGPEIFYDLIRAVNPRCKILYVCSDTLDTIGASFYLKDTLARIAPGLDGIRIPSPRMRTAFPPGCRLYYVPHGIDALSLQTGDASPYQAERNAVSVGNMLFDPAVFEAAAPAYPDVQFHVIGGGPRAASLSAPNITVYDEMPFSQTLAYIRYADVGVAPYQSAMATPYLTDTSMKLMQYAYFGLPAVCPSGIAAGYSHRFGYDRAVPGSIIAAMGDALAYGRFQGDNFLSWAEVTQRLLAPEAFPDTAIK